MTDANGPRPGKARPKLLVCETNRSTEDGGAMLAALRRRRVASCRLPPLAAGRRDPLDPDRSAALAAVRAARERSVQLEEQAWRAAVAHLAAAVGVDVRWATPLDLGWWRETAA